jgi:hypothetical protein
MTGLSYAAAAAASRFEDVHGMEEDAAGAAELLSALAQIWI